MPYIKEEFREKYDDKIETLIKELCKYGSSKSDIPIAGDVNYCITRIVNALCPQSCMSYNDINTAMGVLECAKLELYRRVAIPYENKKKSFNGDVKEYLLSDEHIEHTSTLDV